MSRQATSDGQLSAHRHLRARHRPRHGPGAGAEPRRDRRAAAARGGAPARRHGAQELARPADGRSTSARRTARYDQLYISQLRDRCRSRDVLARLDGVGDVQVFGARDYSMRVWLDPEQAGGARPDRRRRRRRAARRRTSRSPSGVADQPPVPDAGRLPAHVETLGPARRRPASSRTSSSRPTPTAASRASRDVARVELGAQDYGVNGYLDERPAVAAR